MGLMLGWVKLLAGMDAKVPEAMADSAFIDACEEVISVGKQAWITH